MPQYKREQWVLAGRIRGAVAEENFRVSSEDVPEMRKGEILCRALYISIDPITRYNSSVFAWYLNFNEAINDVVSSNKVHVSLLIISPVSPDQRWLSIAWGPPYTLKLISSLNINERKLQQLSPPDQFIISDSLSCPGSTWPTPRRDSLFPPDRWEERITRGGRREDKAHLLSDLCEEDAIKVCSHFVVGWPGSSRPPAPALQSIDIFLFPASRGGGGEGGTGH